MSLVVYAMGAYPTYPTQATAWRRADYDINKVVKALKGEQVNGYARVSAPGVPNISFRIDQQNAGQAFNLFGTWANRVRQGLNLGGNAVLVPLPSSQCIAFGTVTTPSRLADNLAMRSNGSLVVQRWLRFRQVMQRSHEGGTRSDSILQAAMEVAPTAEPARVILVDDVKTTGAHLRAAARALRQAGCNVEHALVAAATAMDPVNDPWALEPEELERPSAFDSFDFDHR